MARNSKNKKGDKKVAENSIRKLKGKLTRF